MASALRPHRFVRPVTRRPRGRTAVVAVLVGTLVWGIAPAGLAAASAASAVAAADRDAGAADEVLAVARTARSDAERRRVDLTGRLAALDAELASRYAGAADLAADLESAQRTLRHSVMQAYVAGGDDGSVALLGGGDLAEQSARRTYASASAVDWADAADRLQQLKEDNDPALVALAARREALATRVAQATDAALQSAAVEAEAERQAARAHAAAAEAAAAAQAARDAAARDAASRPSAARGSSGASAATASSPAASVPAPSARAATAPQPVVPHDEPSAPLPDLPPFGPSPEAWAQVRDCESGGNYRAVSGSGRYRGAYQFDQQTWEAMGGLGDPAAAPPVEQDARAALLFSQRGARAWPVCGRALLSA